MKKMAGNNEKARCKELWKEVLTANKELWKEVLVLEDAGSNGAEKFIA